MLRNAILKYNFKHHWVYNCSIHLDPYASNEILLIFNEIIFKSLAILEPINDKDGMTRQTQNRRHRRRCMNLEE